jgi:hypothetical protein
VQRGILNAQVSIENRRRKATLIRRIIMDRPKVSFGFPAVVVAAVALGLFELITPCQFGIVWAQEKKAEETKKEEKKQEETGLGFTCRSRLIQRQGSLGSTETTEMIRVNPQYGYQIDNYDQGKLTRSTYCNYTDGTMVYLFPALKTYTRKTGPKGPPPDGQTFLDPRPRIKKARAGAHKELGRRTIDGVQAEGIEIPEISGMIGRMGGGMGMSGGGAGNAPAGTSENTKPHVITSGVSAASQLWSSVETGLPILVEESAAIDENGYRMKRIIDQFRWNVRFDPNEFQAKIPPDYQLYTRQPGQGGFGGPGRGAGMRSPAPPRSGRKTRR